MYTLLSHIKHVYVIVMYKTVEQIMVKLKGSKQSQGYVVFYCFQNRNIFTHDVALL